MKAHQLDTNGVITNTILVEDLNAFPNLVDASIGGTIGDSIINGVLIPAPVVVHVPQSVTRRQALQALFLAGKTAADIETAISNALSSPQKDLALIEFRESLDFERSRPLVNALGPLLGLSHTDIDNLFITAGSL
jgi:hypothetical protein